LFSPFPAPFEGEEDIDLEKAASLLVPTETEKACGLQRQVSK